jgi:hypothetical protein
MSTSIGDPSVKKQPERPVLITNAARSQSDQLHSREIRYVTMMGLRVSCLIAGAILISVRPPLLPLWLTLCAAGMVLLPWMAVLIANDRPPKSKMPNPVRPVVNTERQLEDQPHEEPGKRTIDADD